MTSPERLKGIDAFVETAESGSFTAAAVRLKITNSAVSKAVARLELRLGTRLFARTTRRLSLTDSGAAFYRTCRKILADLEQAEAVLAAERIEPLGRLRIDIPVSYGRLHVLPLLLQFSKDYPGLRPHISFSDHFVDIHEEEIDVIVRIGGPDNWPASIGRQYLGTEKVIFCASPGYLQRTGQLTSLADLDRHDCIIYKKGDGSVTPWVFKESAGGPNARRIVDARIAVGHGEAEVAAVLAGCGVAQLPTWLVQKELESGQVIEVLPELSTSGWPISIMWLKSRQIIPKVALLVERLTQSLTTAKHSEP